MPCLDHELDALLTRVRPKLAWVLASFRVPEQDAQDLVQDALLSLVKCWPTVRTPDTWLVQAVRYLCCRYLHQERYTPAPIEHVDLTDFEEVACPGPLPQELRELRLDLETLASVLPPSSRRVLRMSLVEGLANAEAAEKLGFKRESVRQNVRRSLKVLKEEAAGRMTFRARDRKP